MPIDYSRIPSPCYVLDEKKLVQNLEIIQRVQKETGVKIVLAFKAFAMWSVFPLIREYVQSAAVSSLNEAKLWNTYLSCLNIMFGMAIALNIEYSIGSGTKMRVSNSIPINSLPINT